MILGVDIGGTKTLLSVFDVHGVSLESVKFETPKDYDEFLDALSKSLTSLSNSAFDAACIAVPGRLDRERGIALGFGNLPWENIPIQSDIERLLSCPAIIENDAKLAGLAEATSLNGDQHRILYVTISTGIGLGLTVDGQIDHSVSDAGGKGMILEHDGKKMSWEEFASGKAIVARYGKRASEIEDPKIWREIVDTWVVGFLELIDLTSPDVIIIGGGVGSHFHKYGSLLVNALKAYETNMVSIPPIRAAAHPEEAVVNGCFLQAKQMVMPR